MTACSTRLHQQRFPCRCHTRTWIGRRCTWSWRRRGSRCWCRGWSIRRHRRRILVRRRFLSIGSRWSFGGTLIRARRGHGLLRSWSILGSFGTGQEQAANSHSLEKESRFHGQVIRPQVKGWGAYRPQADKT